MHAGEQICANVHKTEKIYRNFKNAIKNSLIDLQRSGLHQIIACVYTDSHSFTNCACRCAFSNRYDSIHETKHVLLTQVWKKSGRHNFYHFGVFLLLYHWKLHILLKKYKTFI